MHEIRSTILGDAKANLVAHKAKKGEAGTAGLSRIAIKRQETRITNQRLEDRHRDVVEAATIVFRRKRLSVGVVNVSSRGAMLVTDIEPKIGEKLDILFTPDNKTKSAVRWVRAGRIGIEFLDETIFWETGATFRYEPAAPEHAADEEAEAGRVYQLREPRQRLLRSGTLHWGKISIPVRLRNISGGGAQLESDRQLQPGSEVELDLGEGGCKAAEIRWSSDGQVGLRFFEDFDFEALAAQAQPAERPAEMLKPAWLETELDPDSPWAARFERLTLTELRALDKD
ncbi:MAG: PilZ domain-containing protein [Alphaproteobacteria bacterium]|nr:PilZ domain-containing protein [Alphaproteobacteria bacterium]